MSVANAAAIVNADVAGALERSVFGADAPTYSFDAVDIKVGSLTAVTGSPLFGGRPIYHTYHSYYVFDLAAIHLPVTQATLALQLSPTGGSAGIMTVFALENVAAAQLANLSAAASQSLLAEVFTDIGTGAVYGSSSVSGSGSKSFDLAASALTGINAGSGLFALGVAFEWTDYFVPFELIGFHLDGAALTLAGAPPQLVPVPGTLGLLALGGLALLRQRRTVSG